jgi:hypothetical protein
VLRIVVLHELETGLAEEPCWGPDQGRSRMQTLSGDKLTCASALVVNGAAAVSEQQLADQAMDPLNPGSILVGDRNFGVFSIAWQARQRGLDVVIRLTGERARKLAGEPISVEESGGCAGHRAALTDADKAGCRKARR